MRRILSYIIGLPLKIFSILIAVALLLSYLSIYINPEKIWIPAFFGLLFLPLFLLNMLLTVVWLMIKYKTAWINGCSLIPSLFYLPLFIQLRLGAGTPAPATEAVHHIKVVSYNVHLFGLLGKETNMVTLPGITKFIEAENPDIICLQELSTFDTASVNRAFKRYPYHHYHLNWRRNGAFFGIVTFSRYPITDSGNFSFPNTNNRSTFTDIVIAQKVVRVYNTHLQSVHINLEKTALRLQQEEWRNEELRDVSGRLKSGFIKRAQQVNHITRHMDASPYPIVVCGDFNDMPVSYTYRKMKGGRNDCFTEAGSGVASTYKSVWPAFRIDYVFCDKQFDVVRYKIEKPPFSDHYPVAVELRIPKK
ncbi:MAG: endonuclease/exonuclease/phosphatase family protein [Prevotellaceae bacterium]|jgi:endonuclease/exonuclease/phosphatase family metal-dependent hydrolase|nr:endonuclease/exonuclease/phosphatase family protein [Prevotellaceae bacterium]